MHGRELLRAWREATQVDGKKLTQGRLGNMLYPHTDNAVVCQWETDESRKPDLPRAVQIERISKGAVPASVWGYTADKVAAYVASAARVVCDEPSGEHPLPAADTTGTDGE